MRKTSSTGNLFENQNRKNNKFHTRLSSGKHSMTIQQYPKESSLRKSKKVYISKANYIGDVSNIYSSSTLSISNNPTAKDSTFNNINQSFMSNDLATQKRLYDELMMLKKKVNFLNAQIALEKSSKRKKDVQISTKTRQIISYQSDIKMSKDIAPVSIDKLKNSNIISHLKKEFQTAKNTLNAKKLETKNLEAFLKKAKPNIVRQENLILEKNLKNLLKQYRDLLDLNSATTKKLNEMSGLKEIFSKNHDEIERLQEKKRYLEENIIFLQNNINLMNEANYKNDETLNKQNKNKNNYNKHIEHLMKEKKDKEEILKMKITYKQQISKLEEEEKEYRSKFASNNKQIEELKENIALVEKMMKIDPLKLKAFDYSKIKEMERNPSEVINSKILLLQSLIDESNNNKKKYQNIINACIERFNELGYDYTPLDKNPNEKNDNNNNNEEKKVEENKDNVNNEKKDGENENVENIVNKEENEDIVNFNNKTENNKNEENPNNDKKENNDKNIQNKEDFVSFERNKNIKQEEQQKSNNDNNNNANNIINNNDIKNIQEQNTIGLTDTPNLLKESANNNNNEQKLQKSNHTTDNVQLNEQKTQEGKLTQKEDEKDNDKENKNNDNKNDEKAPDKKNNENDITNDEFTEFTYILIKNFESKKIAEETARQKIIMIPSSKDPLDSKKFIDQMSFNIMKAVHCDNDDSLKRVKRWLSKLLDLCSNDQKKMTENFLTLFSNITIYSQEQEILLSKKIKKCFLPKMDIIKEKLEPFKSKYVTFDFLKKLIEEQQIEIKDEYAQYLFYELKKFDDPSASLFDLKIQNLFDILDNNENESKMNIESDIEITNEEYVNIITNFGMQLLNYLNNNHTDLRKVLGDLVQNLSGDDNNEKIEVVFIEPFVNKMKEIGIELNDEIKIYCLFSRYKLSDEYDIISVNLLEKELENFRNTKNNYNNEINAINSGINNINNINELSPAYNNKVMEKVQEENEENVSV